MEKKKREHTKNLKSWKLGQSGNPGGRPKRDVAAMIAQKVFEENPKAIEKAMLKALKKGNPKVFAVLADRAFGKLAQAVAVEGAGGGPRFQLYLCAKSYASAPPDGATSSCRSSGIS